MFTVNAKESWLEDMEIFLERFDGVAPAVTNITAFAIIRVFSWNFDTELIDMN